MELYVDLLLQEALKHSYNDLKHILTNAKIQCGVLYVDRLLQEALKYSYNELKGVLI